MMERLTKRTNIDKIIKNRAHVGYQYAATRSRLEKEKYDEIVECFLLNFTCYDTAKVTGIYIDAVEKVFCLESEAYAEIAERERMKRSRRRPKILRTSSGLMYTR